MLYNIFVMIDIRCVKEEEEFRIKLTATNYWLDAYVEQQNLKDYPNKRYDMHAFDKFFEEKNTNMCYYVMFDDDNPVLFAVLRYNYPEYGYVYLNQFQAVRSKMNYGLMFLRWLDIMNKKLWLVRSCTADESLSEYYRKTNLFNEEELALKKPGSKTSIFYKNCDPTKLKSVFL